MKIKGQKGFTLIELVCVILTTLILALAAGTVLTTSQVSWNRAWVKANLQRDASYAMLRISRHIKAGTSAEPESDGKAIKIYKGANWIRFFLEQDSKDLKYEKYELEELTAETIIRNNVEDLQFDVDGNRVRISLMLKKGDLKTHFVSETMIRNYEK